MSEEKFYSLWCFFVAHQKKALKNCLKYFFFTLNAVLVVKLLKFIYFFLLRGSKKWTNYDVGKWLYKSSVVIFRTILNNK